MNQASEEPQLKDGVFKSSQIKVAEVNVYEFKIRVSRNSFPVTGVSLVIYTSPLPGYIVNCPSRC